MTNFVEFENKNRNGQYKKDHEVEKFLKDINLNLQNAETYEENLNDLPNIFIFGLPRSGTTLAYQLIANSLDVGYINNLMARFWLAPLSGIVLSLSIIGDKRDNSFISDYGVNPTHTKEEFIWLQENYKKNIYSDIAYYDDVPIAGITHFVINKTTKMSFYLCQDYNYKALNAQTFLIKNTLDEAYSEGYKYYDFGTSSANMVARPNIFEFKEGVGASGIFRHSYKLNMENICLV